MKAYIHATIFDGEQLLHDKVVLTEGGKILEVSGSVPEGAETVDCRDGILAPGLIDLQIYGGGGSFFAHDLSAESLHTIAEALVKKGTAGFYITLATNSMQVFKKAAGIVRDNPHPAVLGLNLEGPYINPAKKGAHLEKYIIKPDLEELKDLLKFGQGIIKMMTVAPERVTKETVDLLLKYKVLISAGHSMATFDEGKRGFDWGIQAATHLYNAMSPFTHRDPGLPGAVFMDDQVQSSIIPDGIHVDYNAIRIAKKLLGERLFYITDAIEAVHEGEYIHIRQKDRFTLPDGTLSGSALTMPLAVKNSVQQIGFSLEESLRMSSLYPALIAGIEKQGRILPGYKANFTCFTSELDLQFTTVEDQLYQA